MKGFIIRVHGEDFKAPHPPVWDGRKFAAGWEPKLFDTREEAERMTVFAAAADFRAIGGDLFVEEIEIKWVLVRVGGTPNPALWDSAANEWTAKRGTVYETPEEAEAAAAIFDFVRISGRMEPAIDPMTKKPVTPTVEVVVTSTMEFNYKYGPFDMSENPK